MQLSPAAFNEIRKAVHDLCGIVIAEDKQYLVKSRLEPILHRNGLASYELLVQRLKQPNSLLLQDQMIEAITTKETSFNRDGHPFEELRRSILSELASQLIERKATERLSYPKVRIWCAAVATGQEAYSVAMAVTDFLAARSARGLTVDDFSILASDISSNCARHGPRGTIFLRGTRSGTDRRAAGPILSTGKRSLDRRCVAPPHDRISPPQPRPAAARPGNFRFDPVPESSDLS